MFAESDFRLQRWRDTDEEEEEAISGQLARLARDVKLQQELS